MTQSETDVETTATTPTANVPALPSPEELQQQVSPVVAKAEGYTIDCQPVYEDAAEYMTSIKSAASKLEEQRKAITRPMDEAKKAVMDLFRGPLDALTKAEGVLKDKMKSFALAERERMRKAQQEAEAAAAAARNELEQQAAQAMESGDVAVGVALQTAAETVTAAPPAMEAPKAAGVALRGTWKARVTDKRAFLRHALEHDQFLDMVGIDESALNTLAKAFKDKMAVPGVEPYEDHSISARRR